MRKIKMYSKKNYSLTIQPFYYNPITLFKSCCLTENDFFPFDFMQFTHKFEKKHGLLHVK